MEKLKIIVKAPNGEPKITEVDSDLKSFQEIVGGCIECIAVPSVKNVDMFMNEEGKLDNLPGNVWLPEIEDCAVGTIFMVGSDDKTCENINLSDKQIKGCMEYLNYFSIPKDYDLYYDFPIIRKYMENQYKKYKNRNMEM